VKVRQRKKYVCFVDDFICLEIVGFDYFELGWFLDCVIQKFRVARIGYKTSILPSTTVIGDFTLTAFNCLCDPSVREKIVIPVLDVTATFVPEISRDLRCITIMAHCRRDDVFFVQRECLLWTSSCWIPLIDSSTGGKHPRHLLMEDRADQRTRQVNIPALLPNREIWSTDFTKVK